MLSKHLQLGTQHMVIVSRPINIAALTALAVIPLQ